MKHSLVRLGDICTVVSGSTPKSGISDYWDGDVVWITPAELTEDSYIINDSVRHITQKAVQETSLKPFPAGTVILSSRAPIGKTAIAGREMYCNQGFKNLICSSRVNNKYLYFFLSCKTEYLNSLGRGATFKEISKTIVENIEIPLPGIPEQKRIATEFEHIQGLEQGFQKQVSFFDQLVKSQFVEMFGDPEQNPLEWPIKKLAAVVSSITAGWSANGEARPRKAGEKAVLKVSAVTQGFFKPDEYKVIPADLEIKKYVYPKKGDLLFSRANTRELVGATAVIEEDYPELLLPDKLWKVLFTNEMDVYYAKHILSTHAIRKVFSSQSTGTSGSMYNVSAEKFRETLIPVPPIMLQREFAAFVAQVDKSKVEIQKAIDQLEILKKSLMQQYFG